MGLGGGKERFCKYEKQWGFARASFRAFLGIFYTNDSSYFRVLVSRVFFKEFFNI